MNSTLDPEQLRAAMRAWSAGVTVVTAVHEGRQSGATVNSFTSISLYPPLLTISLQKTAKTHDFIFSTVHDLGTLAGKKGRWVESL
jgi:flavin reductase (DIM6/NTAB) family NADH-FMN oxidoreductase RutF